MTNEWGEVWYYKYDALGRRIEKACPQRNIKTTYLWDGDQVAYQETEKHGKTETLRHCIFNGWALIVQQDSYFKTDLRNHHKTWTQATNYAVCQPNGQPLALFNPQGKRTWRKAQSSLWGLPLLESWESKQAEPLNPNLLFAGQFFDQESGLAYNRFRYYDPQSGCYLKSDPIGLAGGDPPYAYVHNPIDWIDFFGLSTCNIAKNIHSGAQGKHIPGHNNYIPGKSILTEDAQKLLDNFHSGNINSSRIISDSKVKVDFGTNIGSHINPTTGTSTSTSWGIIHSGKNGAHIVPALPDIT